MYYVILLVVALLSAFPVPSVGASHLDSVFLPLVSRNTGVTENEYSFAYGVSAYMLNNDQTGEVMTAVQDLNFYWVKQSVEWKDVEGSQGTIEYDKLDDIVSAAYGAG